MGVAKKRLYALDEEAKEHLKMKSRQRRGNARGSWGLVFPSQPPNIWVPSSSNPPVLQVIAGKTCK